jgi:hypothetical protein
VRRYLEHPLSRACASGTSSRARQPADFGGGYSWERRYDLDLITSGHVHYEVVRPLDALHAAHSFHRVEPTT